MINDVSLKRNFKLSSSQKRMNVLYSDPYTGEIICEIHSKPMDLVNIDSQIDIFATYLKDYAKKGITFHGKKVSNPVLQVYFEDVRLPEQKDLFDVF